MAGTRSSRFFWQDYCNDPALKLCSLAAQGLWMRMLGVCAETEPVGYLRISGQPCSLDDLATITGKPAAELAPLLEELGRRGIYSKTTRGVIYNRRMVRDARKASTARDNGTRNAPVPESPQQRLDLDYKPIETPLEADCDSGKRMNGNDNSAVGGGLPGVPTSLAEESIKNLNSNSLPRAARAREGPNRADPAVRKQIWEGRVLAELRATLVEDEYVRVATAYADSEPWAKRKFEQIGAVIKARTGAADAEREAA